MTFLEKLKPQGDKATLSEMIFAGKQLPERIVRPIPKCLYHLSGDLDFEVFGILAWIIARRENPEITLQEVTDRIGMKDKSLTTEILKDVVYFFTSLSREKVEEDYAEEEQGEETDINPPLDLKEGELQEELSEIS